MSANDIPIERFVHYAEEGDLPVDSHYARLRGAFFYCSIMDDIFPAVDEFHLHGWSFGSGTLRFNRCVNMISDPLPLLTMKQKPGLFLL